MKKKFLFSALLIAAASSVASAQVVVNNPANHGYFGIRAALDVSIPGKYHATKNISTDLYKAGCGFSLGAIYNAPIVANFYVQPGLSLYYNTMGYDDVELGAGTAIAIEPDHASMRKFGMRVPVMLGYHFDFEPVSIHIFTGPELDVGFTNDSYLKGSLGDKEIRHVYSEYGEHGNRNRVDCYWKAGIGAQFSENYYVDVTGAFGLTNQIKNTLDGYPKWHENYLSVTLGYNF